jgi:predicted TIM-barrel fold metal-dependent hydrolase
VFERFPDLKVTFIETQVIFMEAAINQIDKTLLWSDDWMAFAKFLKRIKPFTKLASEYFASNCFVGVSPFTPRQLSNSELLGKDAEQQPVDGFHIGADNAMFGVDFPHFESIFPNTLDEVVTLTNDPCVSDEDARKILYGNAAKVYGFDLDALQPHIDKVGFELDDPMSATFA